MWHPCSIVIMDIYCVIWTNVLDYRVLVGCFGLGVFNQLSSRYLVLWTNSTHYGDVIMNTMASQITSLAIVYLTVYSGADQRKHQNSASLDSVRGIHRWPVNFLHKGPVTRKMFPFDDVIMRWWAQNVPWGSAASPGYQQPRHWLWRINGVVSSMRKYSNCLRYFIEENTNIS